MSLPRPDPVVSTQYLQVKLPRDDLSTGSGSNVGAEERQTISNSTGDSSPQRKRNGASSVPSCISSTVINLMPSINTAPVASGSNCYFQTRDFQSEEAKQAAANLRDTMAAIADKRSLFFSECPKSPKTNLDALPIQKPTPEHQPPLQRSSLLLERNEGSHNFEITSRDDEKPGLTVAREHPRPAPERTMSGFYFSNLSRRPGGRMSLKTFEMIKNCPSLELYTTAPITAMTSTPPVNVRPNVSPPPLQVSPPPSLSLLSSEPITLEITDSTPIMTGRPSSSPDKYLRISISPCNTTQRRARTTSREEPESCPEWPDPMSGQGAEENGEYVVCGNDRSQLPLDSSKPHVVTMVHDVRFFSAPDAYPFQESDHDNLEGRGADDKRNPSGDDSLPSTPNSGSLSSSMKGTSINRLRSFFSDTPNIFSGDGKQGEYVADLGHEMPHQDKKLSVTEVATRLEKGSFKIKKSNSKQQQLQQHQQQQLQPVPAMSQGSPGVKHKKSPTDKEPQAHKESWKGRVARTIKRYGSGSILLSSEASAAPSTEENKDPKVALHGVFGVPLEVCEVSSNYDLVPLIVEVCVRMVEEKGLDNQGIYRVPGNTGAIKELQDEINKDPKGLCLDNEKWQDVNLVTSLLKLFFRKLPDSLITDRLYEHVIATTRLEKSEKRMLKLKRILHDMPERNFNTFALLAKHLRLVASHEESNKMDAHNLAIMFGPTLIRPKDNNIAIMARNMADQCRVIETIIIHCDWFFSSWDEDVNVPMDGESEESTPVIDEKMVAKAQSLENANQKSSSSSSLHRLPNLTLSSSTSCITSLPLTSPTGWKGPAVNKKFKGGRDGLPPEPRGNHGGQGLKGSSSDVLLNVKNSPLFSPTSKKNFFSWMAKGKCQKQSKPSCPSLDSPEFSPVGPDPVCAEGRVGKEIEIEVKVVRHDRYKLDGQFFGFADNREPPRLPWHKKEGRGSDGTPVFHSGP